MKVLVNSLKKINTTDLIVIGDLHGMLNTLFYHIKQLKLNDITII